MSSNDLDILKDKYHDFRSLCKKVLPKVDPILVVIFFESTPKKSFSNIHGRSIY